MIAEALTADEARQVVAAFLTAVAGLDAGGDVKAFARDAIAVVDMVLNFAQLPA